MTDKNEEFVPEEQGVPGAPVGDATPAGGPAPDATGEGGAAHEQVVPAESEEDRAAHEQVVPAEGAAPTEPIFEIPDDASALLDAQTGGPLPISEASAAALESLRALVDERTVDLQRLQAEYVNYKRRVDRDRDAAKLRGIEAVVLDLVPILDSVQAAKEHEEFTGGLKLIVDELDKLLAKYGLEVYGEVGEAFDPNVHEALMQVPYEGPHDVTIVSAVMQKGVKLHDRVLRPARVGVAEPD